MKKIMSLVLLLALFGAACQSNTTLETSDAAAEQLDGADDSGTESTVDTTPTEEPEPTVEAAEPTAGAEPTPEPEPTPTEAPAADAGGDDAADDEPNA